MNLLSKIAVITANDMVGSAIFRILKDKGYKNIFAVDSNQINLLNESEVFSWYERYKPDYVFCFAGPHGGIIANITYPADFIYQNLKIQNNIIHGAYLHSVKKLLFMCGNCAYPKVCKQPIEESDFQTGVMESTSVAYSMARCAGIEMCLAYNRQYNTCFIPAIFTNYFGINDDYSENGHVLASIMQKMYLAKVNKEPKLVLWGTGEPLRQFLYMDDLAEGAICIMERMEQPELINIAGGYEKSISEVAISLKELIGYSGEIEFDHSKPNGTMRKCLDNKKLRALGWSETVSWEDGLKRAYNWFLEHITNNLPKK